MKEKLIIALDYDNMQSIKNLVESLEDEVLVYKVGLESFLHTDGLVLDYLTGLGKKIFLDLKFHDIQNTVLNAAKYALKKNVFIYNIHASNGLKTMQAVAELTKESQKDTMAIAVTVLTNLADEDLNIMYPQSGITAANQVAKFAELAHTAGMHGIVCSPIEAAGVKKCYGENFITVCPGVRPAFAAKGDQKRIMTPKDAIKNGADFLVVGRPITQADNPANAARLVLSEMAEVNND